jgi:hypothetical protein
MFMVAGRRPGEAARRRARCYVRAAVPGLPGLPAAGPGSAVVGHRQTGSRDPSSRPPDALYGEKQFVLDGHIADLITLGRDSPARYPAVAGTLLRSVGQCTRLPAASKRRLRAVMIPAMTELITTRDWLTVCHLASYARELNPAERVWLSALTCSDAGRE